MFFFFLGLFFDDKETVQQMRGDTQGECPPLHTLLCGGRNFFFVSQEFLLKMHSLARFRVAKKNNVLEPNQFTFSEKKTEFCCLIMLFFFFCLNTDTNFHLLTHVTVHAGTWLLNSLHKLSETLCRKHSP